MPLLYPLEKWIITSGFGDRIHPITNNIKFHNGIDLSAPVGTPLYSPESGKVSKSYTNNTGGKQIIIQHDNGYTTGYAHLNDRLVQVGDRLNRGQIFAHTGNTGASTGPHLHFTVRKDNILIDPENVNFTHSKKKTYIALVVIAVVITVYLTYLKKS